MGIWSVILCLAIGLAIDIRPYIILERALISFAISAMLGYILVSVIERCTSPREISPEGEKGLEAILGSPSARNSEALSDQQSAVSEEQADLGSAPAYAGDARNSDV